MLRHLGRAAVVFVAVYLVVRAAAEFVLVDPGDPASYRTDWGGPSYAGVLLVHVGPGLVVLVLAFRAFRRRRAERGAGAG
jgi:hypothetical protein